MTVRTNDFFCSPQIRSFLLIAIVLQLATNLLAQDKIDCSRRADLLELALNVPDTLDRDTPDITEYLHRHALNDRELLMLFHYWIAHNIDYDVGKFLQGCTEYTDVFATLETGLAMCQGYAELLCDFCDWVDIKCVVIHGYVKGFGYTRGYLDTPNHLWNAVKVDGQWELFDVSWASGYLEPSFNGPSYVRSIKEQYVFADPEVLILTHFPLDERWQLLDQPVTKSDFFSRRHNRQRLIFQNQNK